MRLEDGRQPGSAEDIHPTLRAHLRLLAPCAEGCIQPALRVQTRLHERHAERTALCAHCIARSLGLKIVEHELDPANGTALQHRQERAHLVRQQGDDHEVVRNLLAERVSDVQLGPFALRVDDAAVASQLVQARRPGPRNDRHVVAAATGQLEGEGAADVARPEDDDLQRHAGMPACGMGSFLFMPHSFAARINYQSFRVQFR
jgi:hypothetical protein